MLVGVEQARMAGCALVHSEGLDRLEKVYGKVYGCVCQNQVMDEV